MDTPDPANADSELPETASPAMTFGLMGLLALAGGLIVKRWRTRSQA
jgi:LPXTG-motif cell wall-anchored protein